MPTNLKSNTEKYTSFASLAANHQTKYRRMLKNSTSPVEKKKKKINLDKPTQSILKRNFLNFISATGTRKGAHTRTVSFATTKIQIKNTKSVVQNSQFG